MAASADPVLYPIGLRLQGRRVLVVGGGQVAQRRIPSLLVAGAEVIVVSPEVTPAVQGMSSEIVWHPRRFAPSDLDDVWYAIAATNDAAVNETVVAEAEARRIVCSRSDDGNGGSAWTPAVGRHDQVTVAVWGNRDPRRSVGVRDHVLEGLRDGSIASPHHRDRQPGVVLIGGGPGDPELISVAGRKALMDCDVVVADRLAPRELLADLASDVEIIDVAKLPRDRSAQQEFINRVIVEQARAGKRVARFKGGDNFVFGRGYEEIIACREAGVPVTVIPGITSAIAVPGLVGIPVTHRSVTHEFTVVSGHVPPEHPDSLVNWDALAQLRGTIVLMMAVENAGRIAEHLLTGRPAQTPVAVVCDGSMPTERVVLSTLGTLAVDLEANSITPPAIIVIGDVVAIAYPQRYR